MMYMRFKFWNSIFIIGAQGFRRGSFICSGQCREAVEQHTQSVCDILASQDSLQGKTWFESKWLSEQI